MKLKLKNDQRMLTPGVCSCSFDHAFSSQEHRFDQSIFRMNYTLEFLHNLFVGSQCLWQR